MSFKKGDKLIVVDSNFSEYADGDTVYAYADSFEHDGSTRVNITKTPDGARVVGGMHGFYARRFKLAEPALDFDKPLETVKGDPVVVVTRSGRETDFPVLAYVGAGTGLTHYTANGKYYNNGKASDRDLRNVVPKPLTQELSGYVNVYANGDGTLRAGAFFDKTAEDANTLAVARMKVTFTAVAGQFDK